MVRPVVLLGALLLAMLSASAGASDADTDKSERVLQSLSLLLPDLQLYSVTQSPVPGLYEVVVGPQVIYVTEDARYVLRGDVIDLEQRKNITLPSLNKAKLQAVEKVGEDNMLIFAPENTRYTVTVFTDIDCGFCRKLHKEMDEYNKRGIRVRYLLFPRAGVESPSFSKAVSVWCAKDPKEAMTQAKLGKVVEEMKCDNPVRRHMALGEAMGVTGTPALLLANGEMIPGYIPPDKMERLLSELPGE